MSISGIHRWLAAQSVLWLPLLGFAAWRGADSAVVGGISVVTAVLMSVSYAFLWRILDAGRRLADWVTLGRFLGLVALVVAGAVLGSVSWPLWAAAVLVVASDLLDGYCARRWGGSDAGAVLDMETDQFTTLGLALWASCLAGAGSFVLLLPAFKYGAVLWMMLRRLPAYDPKPCDGDNRRGRLICALVMILLLLCTMPATPHGLRLAAGWLAVAALALSFGGDALHLLRRDKDENVSPAA